MQNKRDSLYRISSDILRLAMDYMEYFGAPSRNYALGIW